MEKWKTLSSKITHDNHWLRVRQSEVELPNGTRLDDYFTWLEGDVAFVFPVTADNHVILVKQYKHAAGEILIEFPAGYVEKNEAPGAAAKRELLEETGYSFKKLTKLFVSYPNPTKIVGKHHFYLAEDCFIPAVNLSYADETENIEVLIKPIKEVYEMLVTNEIEASGSIALGFMALQKLNLINLNE